MDDLSDREEQILEAIVLDFIKYAIPVGSNQIRKKYELDISPATIRNTMSYLEDMGLLYQPHTSAGRIPTYKGYRYYVDSLMKVEKLSRNEQSLIDETVLLYSRDIDELLKKTSRLLGKFSEQLGVVLAPRFYKGRFERIELFSLASDKVLVILELSSGLIKTLVLEVSSEIPKERLDVISGIINERLYGLTLREIKEDLDKRLKDISVDDSGLIKLFIDSANRSFNLISRDDIHYGGTSYIMSKPEFRDPRKFGDFIGFIEDEQSIINLLERRSRECGVSITIGEENEEEKMKDYSIISANYKFFDVDGTLAIIGPTRMKYEKVISLINYTSTLISGILENRIMIID